eukprot:1176337-Prorocentrum_minimum.AAC.2
MCISRYLTQPLAHIRPTKCVYCVRFAREGREGDPGRGGQQGTRPRAGQLGGPASRGLRGRVTPGVDGRKGLRLQFNSRQSTLVYHSAHGILNIPPNIRRTFPADRLPLAGRQSTPRLGVTDSGPTCTDASVTSNTSSTRSTVSIAGSYFHAKASPPAWCSRADCASLCATRTRCSITASATRTTSGASRSAGDDAVSSLIVASPPDPARGEARSQAKGQQRSTRLGPAGEQWEKVGNWTRR